MFTLGDKFKVFDITNLMDSQFLRFCEPLGLWVVAWLYEFSSLFTDARSLKFQRLRLKEDFDIIVELKRLVVQLRV